MKTPLLPRFNGGFFRLPLQFIAIFFILLTWQSCTEPDGIGLNLIDDRAGFLITDTVSIVTYFERDDTIPANIGYQNLLGMMHDPVFGKVRASIMTQFRLSQNNFSLGTEPVLDSIVLSLGYTGQFYGNEETFQTIRVYELDEHIHGNDSLFEYRDLAVLPGNIGQRILRPAPADSTLIDTLMYAPHFTMRLSDSFGQKIIDANGTEYFANVSSFLEYFKGLKITVEDDFSEGGSIFNINMFSNFTVLRLYYHEAADTVPVPKQFSFFISEFTNRFTFAEHFDYQGSHPLILDQLNNPGQTNDSLIFLKALGGLRGRIHFPYLYKLAGLTSITINQAQLIIPVEEGFIEEKYYAARRLFLVKMDDENELATLRDYDLGQTYFGGVYNETSKQYEFNITQHLQEVLSGNIQNNELVLMVSGSAENAERVVLRGPGRSEKPMKLKIRYSVFN